MVVLDSGKVVQTWVKVFGQFFCWWGHRTDLNFRTARCLLARQATVPTALIFPAPKGLLNLGIAFQGGFFLGWQVPLASKVVGAPSSSTSCSGQVRSVVPSLNGQSGSARAPCASFIKTSCGGGASSIRLHSSMATASHSSAHLLSVEPRHGVVSCVHPLAVR